MNAAPCKECGSDPVNHTVVYITVAMDETMKPLFAPGALTRFLMGWFYSLERLLTPYIFEFCIAVGLAKAITVPDEYTILLAKMLWQEAKERGIEVREWRLFGLPRNMFIAKFPNGKRIAYEGIPMPPGITRQVWWIDNKARMKREFKKRGIPIAKGGAALTDLGALHLYKKLEAPVIVKPYSGSASRHTTLHITDETELIRAVHVARQVAPLAMVEEELVGPVYRATVVNGKLEGVLRRDPPHVIGDGVHTITDLMAQANKNPQREGPYFSKLKIDKEALEELAWQDMTPESIPAAGKRITLNQKVNWSLGGTTADVTDETHGDNKELFEKAAETLHAPVVGMDVIIEDMATSWKAQARAGIIECNSMPFFDNHHLPFEGKVRNVAGAIWTMVAPR